MKLRDYQESSVNALLGWNYRDQGNPLIVLPTGAGKSIVIAEFIKRIMSFAGQRVIMLVHSKELVAQNADKLKKLYPDADIGIYSASLGRRDITSNILFAGIQSVYNKANLLGKFDIAIIDECHTISAKDEGIYRKFISAQLAINPKFVIAGLTATPFRTGHGTILEGDSPLFGGIAHEVNLLDLFDDGYLSPVIPKQPITTIDTSGLHTRMGEFIPKEIDAVANTDEITKAAVTEIIEQGRDRKSWLVFCAGVDHAENVAREIRSRGVTCQAITGKTPKHQRDEWIDQHGRGSLQCITNANVLTTGYDCPRLDLIALLRPTKSPVLYIQMIGRGTRLCPETNKQNCLVLDFAGNVMRHGPIDLIKPWAPTSSDNGSGDAPVKMCQTCRTLCPASSKSCINPTCHYVFPENTDPKHEARAGVLSLLSDRDRPLHEPIITVPVTAMGFTKHAGKRGRPPTIKATFIHQQKDAGFGNVDEYLCVKHGGPASSSALRTMQKLGIHMTVMDLIQNSVDEIIATCNKTANKPSTIKIDTTKKFNKILKFNYV